MGPLNVNIAYLSETNPVELKGAQRGKLPDQYLISLRTNTSAAARRTDQPTIKRITSSTTVVGATLTSPTTLPRRSTMILPQIARFSCRL